MGMGSRYGAEKFTQISDEQIRLLKSSKGNFNKPDITKQVDEWNEWRRKNKNVKPCLDNIDFSGLNLSFANFRKASLEGANFSNCQLFEADYVQSKLKGASFFQANLWGALFDIADMRNVDLRNSKLYSATLVETDLSGANISGAEVYGVSTWNVKLEETIQNDLIITPPSQAELTVDNLELAQFTYLLIENRKLRYIINTITAKVVLILGRFTNERKKTLDAIRNNLREYNYIPILFDFTPSSKRDLTETVILLASMAKFVIVDLTEAKSVPQELSHIIPHLPSVPVQPILLASYSKYSMFEHWENYSWVHPVLKYESEKDLLDKLGSKLIPSVDAWLEKQNETEFLRNRIKELEAKLAKKS